MLSRWRYKVVAHAEGGRRAAFDQIVEEQQNGYFPILARCEELGYPILFHPLDGEDNHYAGLEDSGPRSAL